MVKADKTEKKKNTPAFLRNTYQMLERQQLNPIVCWAEAGNGFIIKNLALFQKEILPQYFKHQKYTSFVRQLNMYGFHKQKEKCHSSYHYFGHDSFKRRDMESHDTTVVLATIKRKPEKKKRVEQGAIDRQDYEQGGSQKMVKEESEQSVRSVSLALQHEMKPEMSREELRDQKKQSRSQQCHSQNKPLSSEQMQGEEEQPEQVGDQSRGDTLSIVIRQNESLRALHAYIRQQTLKFSFRNIEKKSGKWNETLEAQQRTDVSILVSALKQQTEIIRRLIGEQQQVVQCQG